MDPLRVVSNVSYPIGVYCEWMLTPNHFQVVSLTQIRSTPPAATDLQLTLTFCLDCMMKRPYGRRMALSPMLRYVHNVIGVSPF